MRSAHHTFLSATPPLPTLSLRTLGGLAVESENGTVSGAATQRRPLALLALVANAGAQGLSRDQILLYLWPDSTPERARHVLKQTLYALRRDLKAPELFLGTDPLRLNPAVISSDVADFEDALDHGEHARALEIYRGAFLEGFHLPQSPEFQRWLALERARLTNRFAEAIESLATRASRAGEHQCAVKLWQRLVAADPTNSQATLALMSALIAAGHRSAALQYARIYDALSREERRLEPDPAVGALAQEIRGTAPRSSAPHRAVLAEALGTEVDGDTAGPQLIAHHSRTSERPPNRLPRPPRTGLPRWRALAWWLPAATVVLALALAMVARHTRLRFAGIPQDSNLVVVCPYSVLDPELGLWREGFVDVLSQKLDGVGPLRSVAPSVVLSRWRGHTDAKQAAELGRRTGAGLAIFGTLVRAGTDSVLATATLVDARTSRVLGNVERRDAVVRMDQLTEMLSLEVLRLIQQQRPIIPLQPHSTSSPVPLEALKAFLRGEQFYRHSRWDSARVYYERAISLDSTFALAWKRLGNVSGWQRLTVDSVSLTYLLRAGTLNQGLSPADSLLVLTDSLTAAANLTNSAREEWSHLRRLFATLEEARERYPHLPGIWLAIGEAGYHFGTGPVIGMPDKEILAAFDTAIALDSAFAPAYIHATELSFTLGDPARGLRYARKYLALNPEEPLHRGVDLILRLVGPNRMWGLDLERFLDTVATEALVSARTMLRRWPDSAETAVLLSRLLAAGRPSTYPLFSDTAFMRRRLAQELAFRGHLRESYRVLGNREFPIFAELAFLGAIPQDTARTVFGRWAREASAYARLGLPWWSARADSGAIKGFYRAALRRLRTAPDEDVRLGAHYDTTAAAGHLWLARGDSVLALRQFLSLPDTLCPDCYLDRLIRARLLAASGQVRQAFTALQEPLSAFVTPMEVVFALERGRLAERLGDYEHASGAYHFVRAAWARADPELEPEVAEARAGIERTRTE
jgi:DNA-binding SARP family transcriptional activator